MRVPDEVWLGGTTAAVLAAAALDVLLYARAPLHAGLLAGLVALTAGTVLHLTRSARWTFLAATAAALWSVPHGARTLALIAALAPGALLVVRASWLGPSPRIVSANVAAVLAGGATFVLLGDAVATLLAVVIAAALAWVRPEAPTDEMRHGLRTLALLVPVAGLTALLMLNAVTGRLEASSTREGLAWGIGLFGLFWLAALALLGAGTLVETTDGRQVGAWTGLSASAGVTLAAFAPGDPSLALTTSSVGIVPLVALAAIACARLGAVSARHRALAMAFFFLPVLFQIGLADSFA